MFYVTNLPVHLFIKILACVYLLFPWLGRRTAVNDAERIDNQNNPQLEKPQSHVECSSAALENNPVWKRLQHLEALVTELSSKPAKIPPEKEHVLHESMDRIKSIEYDLQKTKRVSLPL